MKGPMKASQVKATTELSAEELAEKRRKDVVAARIARRTALKENGADVGVSHETLAIDLERRLKKIDEGTTTKFRAQQAAAKKMEGKR